MNDEIKEILDKMQNFIQEPIEIKMYGISLLNYEVKQLLDYITNLQQKIEQYENPDDMTLFYMWLDAKAKDKIKELQQENERLKEENIEIRQCLLIKRRSIPHKLTMDKSIEEILDMPTYEDYKSRCEKAIEYIKNCEIVDKDKRYPLLEEQFGEDLLNILQNGSDSQ